MTYVVNGLIQASDYNTFRTQSLDVYGVGNGNIGYGQTAIPLPAVSGGFIQQIGSIEWTRLRNVIEVCSNHQGSGVSLPLVTQLAIGSTVRAHPPATGNIAAAITTIGSNRFNFTASRSMVVASALSTSRTQVFDPNVFCEFNVTFPTTNSARYFFNSGGQLLLRATRTGGGATTSNAVITNFLAGVGSTYMNHNTSGATSSTGTGANIGYYNLTNTYQQIYTKPVSQAPHTLTVLRVYAMRVDSPTGPNGDNGRVLRFKYEFTVTNNVVMDGTFTQITDYRIATNFLSITAPSFTLITPISAT